MANGNYQRPSRRKISKKRLVRRRKILVAVCAFALLALIVIGISAIIGRDRGAQPEEKSSSGIYTRFWDTDIEVDPRYPASTIDPKSFVTVDGRKRLISGSVKSCTGIDVSANNGEIDWEAVAADGIEFAMIRVGYRGYTQGGLHEDEYFEKNYKGAKAAGLRVGAYFFSQAVTVKEAEEEAELALKILKNHKLDLPLAYDWETIGEENARADDIDRETLTACTLAFCRKVSKKFDAMIYSNAYQIYYLLSPGELSEYPFWFAGYADSPVLYYKYDIWQYTNEGEVAGIKGHTDLDILFEFD